MNRRILKAVASAAALVLVVHAGTARLSGQAAPPARGAQRTASARPDLSGIWQALTTANWNVQDHSAEPGVPAGTGVVEGNEIPYQPWALAKRAENFKGRGTLDPENSCYMPGVPRAMYMPFPFQILQSPTFVMIAFEYAQTVRRIHVDRTAHPEGIPTSWMGDSRGRWEGKTLVVDTVNFNDQTWFDKAGNFHSDALHVVERFTLRGHDHMDYEVTIEDPKVFTRPWTMKMPLYRRLESHVQLLEYPCVSFLEDEYVKSRQK
jgi:hypothetical protein